MAYIENLICRNCGCNYQGVSNYAGKDLCNRCYSEVAKNKKDIWLDNWRKNLTLEERVSKIEEWIYEKGTCNCSKDVIY